MYTNEFTHVLCVTIEANGSVLRFLSTGSILRLGKVDSAFHLFSASIKEYQAWLGTKTLRVSLQIETSAYAPQRPMVTCTGMGTVSPNPHRLLCY
ncbi:hypothetical protein TNCV_2170611 [Trichonephila clavipes]|nr:hypothetical protein TNCV_2170611 [Trichonephila clavipes]